MKCNLNLLTFYKIIISLFGKRIHRRMNSTWPTKQPKWEHEYLSLLVGSSTNQLPKVNLDDIIQKSKEFPIKFPVNTMLCHNLTKTTTKEKLEKNIQSAYPIIHEHSLYLCAKFLLFKRNHGTKKEQKFYAKVSLNDLIQRLLCKRAVSFMGHEDSCLLLDKTKSFKTWDAIGSKGEKSPFVLENCISYDEIKLSALLSVSSYTHLLNNGNRFNAGFVDPNRDHLEQEGIIIGLIGARFERKSRMEYEEIIVSLAQNTPEKGYGDSAEPSLNKIFAEFYEDPSFVYKDSSPLHGSRFFKLEIGTYFDNVAFAKRLALSFDTLLIEANHRAKEQNKTAYIYVVGFGLGVWKISSHQTQLFVDTFGQRLKFFGKSLSNVSDVHFAYIFGATTCLGYEHGDTIPIDGHNGIKIHISKREPHSNLSDKSKLLVASYAWDGNAFPGNEFWIGMLTSTGDCAAACSTQITELHNPYINPLVCADNLHVAMLDGSVKSLKEVVEIRRGAPV